MKGQNFLASGPTGESFGEASAVSNYDRKLCMISGFRREGDENYALLGYYAASSGNSLLTFQDR